MTGSGVSGSAPKHHLQIMLGELVGIRAVIDLLNGGSFSNL